MIRGVISFFSSLRVSITLIVSLSLIFLMGLWIPQKGLLGQEQYLQWKQASPTLVPLLERAGFTEIYTCTLTTLLWVLFFLNLGLVMYRRAKALAAVTSLGEKKVVDPRSAAGYPVRSALHLSGSMSPERLAAILRKERYRCYGSPDGFYAVRNRLSPYATLLFHFSFFLILLGGVAGVYTRFEGTVDLAEGEEFHGELERYRTVRLPKMGGPPRLDIAVERIVPETVQGKPTGIGVTLNAGGTKRDAAVNTPFVSGSTSLVIKDLGVAPLFVLSDAAGKEVDGAFVKLSPQPKKDEAFTLGGLEVGARFFPDYVAANGVEDTRSTEFRNPAYHLWVREKGAIVGRNTVLLGESAQVAGYRFSFPELHYWVRFAVVSERGSAILLAGFLAAVIGLGWRLLFFRREVVGALVAGPDGTVLHLAGRADYYRVLFEEEFAALAQRLQEAGE